MVHESLEIICEIVPQKSVYVNLLVKNWKLDKPGNLESYNTIAKYLVEIDAIVTGDHNDIVNERARLETLADCIYADKTIHNLLVYKRAKDLNTKLKASSIL